MAKSRSICITAVTSPPSRGTQLDGGHYYTIFDVLPSSTEMHELSIALALVEAASAEMTIRHLHRAVAVHVRVGELSGVDRDALQFSFDVAAEGSALEGSQLKIESIPTLVWCDACCGERPVESISSRRCAACHAIAPRIVCGEELELVGLEITADDHPPDRSTSKSAEQE